jgi:hypothetical protein
MNQLPNETFHLGRKVPWNDFSKDTFLSILLNMFMSFIFFYFCLIFKHRIRQFNLMSELSECYKIEFFMEFFAPGHAICTGTCYFVINVSIWLHILGRYVIFFACIENRYEFDAQFDGHKRVDHDRINRALEPNPI